MIEFIECPLIDFKKVTIESGCQKCGHFGGVMLKVMVELMAGNGSVQSTETVTVKEDFLPALAQSHALQPYQHTVQDRFVRCMMPRRIPIECVLE